MKTYEEVAASVFEKSAGIMAARKQRRKRAAAAGAVFAALALTVVGVVWGRYGRPEVLMMGDAPEQTSYSGRVGATGVPAGGADGDNGAPAAGNERTATEAGVPKFGIPEEPTGVLVYSYGGNEIVVNELAGKPTGETEGIALHQTDEVAMTPEELNEYYGTDVFPRALPDGLERLTDRFCVYRNEEHGVYYDGNTMVYSTPGASLFYKDYGCYDLSQPILNVGVSRVFGPAFSDASLTPAGDQPVRASVINGYEVYVYGYKGVNGVDWIACFQKDGVDFQIGGSNIALDDLIYVVNGYLF